MHGRTRVEDRLPGGTITRLILILIILKKTVTRVD